MKKINVKILALIAVMSSVTAVLSQVAIPLPSGVPATLQTFAIALCGYILGKKFSVISVLVYIAMGIVGIPVFANFNAGIPAIAGVTGGFIWGFILLAFFCGLAKDNNNKIIVLLLSCLGLAACHFAGAVQFVLVSGVSVGQAVLIASLPYIIKDILSVAAAYIVAISVVKVLKRKPV